MADDAQPSPDHTMRLIYQVCLLLRPHSCRLTLHTQFFSHHHGNPWIRAKGDICSTICTLPEWLLHCLGHLLARRQGEGAHMAHRRQPLGVHSWIGNYGCNSLCPSSHCCEYHDDLWHHQCLQHQLGVDWKLHPLSTPETRSFDCFHQHDWKPWQRCRWLSLPCQSSQQVSDGCGCGGWLCDPSHRWRAFLQVVSQEAEPEDTGRQLFSYCIGRECRLEIYLVKETKSVRLDPVHGFKGGHMNAIAIKAASRPFLYYIYKEVTS